MRAKGQQHVRTPDAQPRAVRQALQHIGLGGAIARHARDFEGHVDLVAEAVAVVGRKIAQDAALHLHALSLHDEALGDGEAAFFVDADVAMKFEDALDRMRVEIQE